MIRVAVPVTVIAALAFDQSRTAGCVPCTALAPRQARGNRRARAAVFGGVPTGRSYRVFANGKRIAAFDLESDTGGRMRIAAELQE